MAPIVVPNGGVRRRRSGGWKGLVIACCAVLAGGLSVSTAGAAGAADALVRVRLLDERGVPIAGTAVLATVLWTSKKDYERYGRPRGKLLRTSALGDLLVPIKLDRQQRAAVARNGDWANVSIVAIDALGRPIATATAIRYLGARADQQQRARTMANAGAVRLVTKAERTDGAAIAAADEVAAAAITHCDYYWDEDGYSLRYAQVGELHVDSDVPYARFTYGRTADTTFDMATKAGGADWEIAGSVHVGNTLDSSVYANAGGQTNYHWALRTQFRFVSMKLFKDCVGGPYRAWTGTQETHALEWTGNGMTLSNQLPQLARRSANTAIYGSNTGWSRSTGTLIKWSATVTAFGAKLGAQSGASTNVRIDYAFGSRQTHYLYGDTGLPSVAKRVFQDTP